MIRDDRLDVQGLVPGPHRELLSVEPQPLVLVERHRDPLGADGVAALANDVELGQNVAEPLGNPFQTLVDVTKENLVLDDAFLVLFDGAPRPGPRRERSAPSVAQCGENPNGATFTFSVNAGG